VKDRSRVHLHIGTSEVIARVVLYNAAVVKAGEKVFAQLRLEQPVISMSGDRFVLRRLSPVETIGGGTVLDPLPVKRKKKDGIEDLTFFESGSLREKLSFKIKGMGSQGMTVNLVEGWIDEQRDEIKESLEELRKEGIVMLIDDTLMHRDVFNARRKGFTEILRKFHKANPLKPGMPKEEVRRALRMDNRMFMSFASRVPEIVAGGDVVRMKDFSIALSGVDEEATKKIYDMIEKGQFKPLFKEEIAASLSKDAKSVGDILKILMKEGKIVRINDSIYLTSENTDVLQKKVKEFFSKKPEMTVAEFRDLLDTSRKFALPYLEYLDAAKVTIRVGEVRKLLKK
jgi:selenocysteine-specific elongation factor